MASRKPAKRDSLHQAFVKMLLKAPLRNVRFRKNKISLEFFGHVLSDTPVIKKEEHVAEWSRRRKEIFIDKKFDENHMAKSYKALCVHEAIEKFLVEKFGLRLDAEAHVIATQKEKEYLKSINGNWRSHELIVYWDWHKMGEH